MPRPLYAKAVEFFFLKFFGSNASASLLPYLNRERLICQAKLITKCGVLMRERWRKLRTRQRSRIEQTSALSEAVEFT
jgi:hypothetical protein